MFRRDNIQTMSCAMHFFFLLLMNNTFLLPIYNHSSLTSRNKKTRIFIIPSRAFKKKKTCEGMKNCRKFQLTPTKRMRSRMVVNGALKVMASVEKQQHFLKHYNLIKVNGGRIKYSTDIRHTLHIISVIRTSYTIVVSFFFFSFVRSFYAFYFQE